MDGPTRLVTARPFRAARLLAAAAVVGLGAWLAHDPPAALHISREKVWDLLVAARPRPVDPGLNVRVVDIDERSLAVHGQFPWPRTRQARLLRALADQGARVVAFDFIFPEPDRTSIGNVLRSLTEDLPDYRPPLDADTLAAQPDNDRILAEAMARVPTVLGFTVGPRGVATNPPAPASRIEFENRRDQRFIEEHPGVVASLPSLQDAAAGNGSLAMSVDLDGVLRHVPLLVRAGGRTAPSLSVETLRIALGAPIRAGSRAPGLSGIRIGETWVPSDRHGRMRLYDSGHRPDRYVSAADVLDGRLPPGFLKESIVFLGTSAEGLKDIRSTPLHLAGPGVEAHAQAVEQMLSGRFLRRLDGASNVEAAFILGIGLLLLGLAARPVRAAPPWLAAGTAATAMAGAAWIGFARYGILIDPLIPGVTLLTAGVTERLILLAEVRLERSRIRNAFSRYLSPDVVARVSADPAQLRLGGDRRDLSVMFADIRGFTSLSQRFTDRPEALTQLINRLLTPLTEVVLRHGGTVDKYMGDCVMAFWNAPLDVSDHARAACRAAIDMRAALNAVNAELTGELGAGIPSGGIDIGIGINSGTCFVGNMGSEQRLDYSVIGDTVNLASRLEGQCKTYRVGVVLSADTVDRLDGAFAVFELDKVVVKGRHEPTSVFTLLGPADGRFDDLIAAQSAFLAAYRSRDWDSAGARLADLAARPDAVAAGLAAYLESMTDRVAALRRAPPPEDWDGRFIATGK